MSEVHEFTSMDGEADQLIQKQLDHTYVRFQGTVVGSNFRKHYNDYVNFEVRDDDFWVCSFPKTGTTWTQEMVWCIANDLDFKGAEVDLLTRFPFIEYSATDAYVELVNKYNNSKIELPRVLVDSFGYVKDMPSPRFIKTHMPFHMLPLKLQRGETRAKIVYVARNDKDTCVSMYHFSRIVGGFKGSLDDFATLFMKNCISYTPFWKHVLSFWERRNNPNILFLKFEDLKKDLACEVRRTAKFLGKSLEDYQVDELCEHLSFEKMRVNPAVNYEKFIGLYLDSSGDKVGGVFIRSGQVGGWKMELSSEMQERFEKWTEENQRETDLRL